MLANNGQDLCGSRRPGGEWGGRGGGGGGAVGGGYLNKWPLVARGEENVYINDLTDAAGCNILLPDAAGCMPIALPDNAAHAQGFSRILAPGLGLCLPADHNLCIGFRSGHLQNTLYDRGRGKFGHG